jgi:POT family proton-dependent oligopeptide transporter
MNDQAEVIGHPPGLFILFFTEMWERFSYYGMRGILVIFLTTEYAKGGWGWTNSDALRLYAAYTALVYLTPIFGGIIADKILGYRMAVVLGAIIMTLGHASMAMDTHTFFYIGLALLIIGNGLFKPNISSIVGELYEGLNNKKDAGYSIFYMGINAGAFLGILLCGYIGEKTGWSYGFGLAGVFMFLGMLQFWFAKKIFGDIGLKPSKALVAVGHEVNVAPDTPAHISRDRIIVIGVFAFFTIFFWMMYEQAGGSMTIFAKDYTNRVLEGNSSDIFKWCDTLLVLAPMIILTIVLIDLFKKTYKNILASNLFLGLGFTLIWILIIWMLHREFSATNSEVPASWFGILNSFFIIALAPLFSKIWESKYNPSGPVKFALGLILLGAGFGLLAYGSSSVSQGARTASVSMIWLILAYLLHTMGELCLSPVGLSYVSKLSPPKIVGLMFGVWFIANFIGNYLAGITGSFIDKIVATYSLSVFFLFFTILPLIAGVILISLNRLLIKKMHGFK